MVLERKPLQILIAEDDMDDRVLMELAFQNKCEGQCSFRFFENGRKLTDFLDAQTELDWIVVILDLNMPVMSGREALVYIKQTEKLKKIPTMTLTTSSSPEDIAFCYDAGASNYFIKPVDFDSLEKLVGDIVAYWNNAVLP
jgi:CheY-like chemotaxis protein